MIDSFRAERQLELLLTDINSNVPTSPSEGHRYPISTIYYWPNRQEIEVVPYGGENVKT